VYGIDVEDPAVMRGRSWRWLRTRILGLLSTDCRIARHFTPQQQIPRLPAPPLRRR
jgi:hypothetical protein